MTVEFMESFDHLTLAQLTRKWVSVTSTPTITASGRTGSGLSVVTTFGKYIKKDVASRDTVIVGFAFKATAMAGTVVPLVSFLNGTQVHCGLMLSTAYALSFSRNGSGSHWNSSVGLGASADGVITEGVWHYIEAKVTISDIGLFIVHVDGAEVLNVNPADTKFSTTGAVITNIELGSGAFTNLTAIFDDFYIVDPTSAPNDDFLGDVRVYCLYPEGVGNSSQWTPGGSGAEATGWESTDEATPDDDVTNITDATTNHVDTYEFQDLPAGVTSIKAVQVNIIAKKDDVGVRQIAPVVRPVATDRVGTTVTLSTDYADHLQVYNVSPETSAAWDVTEVNNSEFGVKEIT